MKNRERPDGGKVRRWWAQFTFSSGLCPPYKGSGPVHSAIFLSTLFSRPTYLIARHTDHGELPVTDRQLVNSPMFMSHLLKSVDSFPSTIFKA